MAGSLPAEACAKTTNEASCPEVVSNTNEMLAIAEQAVPQAQARPKILVVDDEVMVRELLREMLESESCEVTLAGGGHEALQILDQTSFDAVFTDVGMPGMSGWEFARAIRQRDTSIPIAVITGWGEAVGSVEQKAAQVDWIITKPFSADRIDELAKEISQHRCSSQVKPPLIFAA
jgi:CheY-like chemotaxis protein